MRYNMSIYAKNKRKVFNKISANILKVFIVTENCSVKQPTRNSCWFEPKDSDR